jgi:archaellum component FlaC
LSYETNRLSSQQGEFVHYVEEKGKEVHELKDQISRLKKLVAQTNNDISLLASAPKRKPSNDDLY